MRAGVHLGEGRVVVEVVVAPVADGGREDVGVEVDDHECPLKAGGPAEGAAISFALVRLAADLPLRMTE